MSTWLPARLVGREDQSATGRTLYLDVPRWPGHLAGQHVDVRLTADDGYHAVRSYSLAAPAEGSRIELGVQSVPGGEVSPYLADDLPLSAEVEVRGPLGGWFVWRPDTDGPVLLVAGGCGIVPLMAMIRAHRNHSTAPMHLVYSVRDPGQIWYHEELTGTGLGTSVHLVHTRQAPPGSSRPPGRVTASDLALPTAADSTGPECFVCGPTGFVEHAAGLLTDAGHPPGRIRTERFG